MVDVVTEVVDGRLSGPDTHATAGLRPGREQNQRSVARHSSADSNMQTEPVEAIQLRDLASALLIRCAASARRLSSAVTRFVRHRQLRAAMLVALLLLAIIGTCVYSLAAPARRAAASATSAWPVARNDSASPRRDDTSDRDGWLTTSRAARAANHVASEDESAYPHAEQRRWRHLHGAWQACLAHAPPAAQVAVMLLAGWVLRQYPAIGLLRRPQLNVGLVDEIHSMAFNAGQLWMCVGIPLLALVLIGAYLKRIRPSLTRPPQSPRPSHGNCARGWQPLLRCASLGRFTLARRPWRCGHCCSLLRL